MRETNTIDRSTTDIRLCIKSLEKIERNCRRDGNVARSLMIKKAIAQLKMAQRSS